MMLTCNIENASLDLESFTKYVQIRVYMALYLVPLLIVLLADMPGAKSLIPKMCCCWLDGMKV